MNVLKDTKVSVNEQVTEINANIEKLKQQLKDEQAKAKQQQGLTFAVFEHTAKDGSKRTGVKVTGLSAMPVKMYKAQWKRLLEAKNIAALEAYLEKNDAILTDKK